MRMNVENERAEKASAFITPPDQYYVMVWSHLQGICGGCGCAAALLRQIEYLWRSTAKRKTIETTQGHLRSLMVGICGRHKIRTLLDKLEGFGYISVKHDKNEGTIINLHPEVVNARIREVYFDDGGVEFDSGKEEEPLSDSNNDGDSISDRDNENPETADSMSDRDNGSLYTGFKENTNTHLKSTPPTPPTGGGDDEPQNEPQNPTTEASTDSPLEYLSTQAEAVGGRCGSFTEDEARFLEALDPGELERITERMVLMGGGDLRHAILREAGFKKPRKRLSSERARPGPRFSSDRGSGGSYAPREWPNRGRRQTKSERIQNIDYEAIFRKREEEVWANGMTWQERKLREWGFKEEEIERLCGWKYLGPEHHPKKEKTL